MITRRMQIQPIADALAGLDHQTPNLALFDPIYKALYEAARMIPPGAAPDFVKSVLLGALKNRRDAEHVVAAIMATPPGNGNLNFRSLDQIADGLPPIKWFWPGWIANGMLSLFGAQKGAGKTYLMLDLAARVLKNGYFPDMCPINIPDAKVIYVDAEFIPQIINDRCKTLNIDRRRFFTMETDIKNPIDFCTERDKDKLIEMLYAIKPALVVLDSLGNLQSKGENSVEDVRNLMGYFVTCAYEFKVPIVLIHHLRKRNPLAFLDLVSLDDFRGSGHIVNMSRTIMALSIIQNTAQHNPNGPRRLEVISTNLARYPDPIGVDFKPLEGGGVLLDYGECPHEYKAPSQEDKCKQWLLDILGDGPQSPDDLVTLAKNQIGVSRATVFRAHDILERIGLVADTIHSKNPKNEWKLKDWQATAISPTLATPPTPAPQTKITPKPEADQLLYGIDQAYDHLDNYLGGYVWDEEINP